MVSRALDGTAFLAYCRRLGFAAEAQNALADIRSSPPSRTPQASRGNVVVWFPSTKMGCVLKAESHKVEFAALLEAEHDVDVLEHYDQPPTIILVYPDRRGRVQKVEHTPDYFRFRLHSAGWVECKPERELQKLAQHQPHRYQLDDTGRWRCPPGEAYAAALGLTYIVYSSEQINWNAQSNWLYLEDYYQDLDRLVLPGSEVALLQRLVSDTPGMNLADLCAAAHGVDKDHINVAIATNAFYIDLNTYRLSDQQHAQVPVYRDRQTALAYGHPVGVCDDASLATQAIVVATNTPMSWSGNPWRIANVGDRDVTLLDEHDNPFTMIRGTFETLVRDGRIIGVRREETAQSLFTAEGEAKLARVSVGDTARAEFRRRTIFPDEYHDDHQEACAAQREEIPERTQRYWREQYRKGEVQYGSGMIGLMSAYHNCGRRPVSGEQVALIEDVLTTHFDVATRARKRGAWGEYLARCKDEGMAPVCAATFYKRSRVHKRQYEQALARGGARFAYPLKDYYRDSQRTLSVNGDYAWAHGYIDHTPVDLELRHSKTGLGMGTAWLTIVSLGNPRRVVAFYLSYEAPSYLSCLMVLRLCVLRFGRLPSAITVDGGVEFGCIFFEQFLALYRIRKYQRPRSEPRFGAPIERVLGTTQTEFIHHLLGNTQALKQPRTVSRDVDPRRLAVWTLPALANRLRVYFDDEYDTSPHPALLNQSPRQAYDASMQVDGSRQHKLIPYNEAFVRDSMPTTRSGKALVQPGIGVRIRYQDYWCEEMRDPTAEKTAVRVRYDPLDVTRAYAYIQGQWRLCLSPCSELAGCTEREYDILVTEYRKTLQLLHGKQHVNMKQEDLARFRRENVAVETLLAQQHKDHEMKAALAMIENRNGPRVGASGAASYPIHPVMNAPASATMPAATPDHARTLPIQGGRLVPFKRHQHGA